MSTTRNRALLLAVLMLTSAAAILPTPDAAAQDANVPKAFSSAGLTQATLNFFREGGQTGCQVNSTEDGQLGESPFCSSRVTPLPDPDQAKQETRSIRGDPVGDTIGGQTGDGNESSIARFALDTDGNGGERGAGAQFPFTIKAGANAIQYKIWYDVDTTCDGSGGNPDNPIDFTFQLRRQASDGSFSGIIERTRTTETACSTTDSVITDNGASLLSASVNLDQGVTIQEGQGLVVEVFAARSEDAGSGSNWAIFFEDVNRDSKVVLSTNQLVEKAVWATDQSGTHKTTFDPDAPESERFLVGHMALRSPFGPRAVPSDAFSGQIEDPTGSAVDLVPAKSGKQSVIAFNKTQLSEDPSLKIYRFAKAMDTQVWHYPEGVDSGPYTVRASGSILDGKRLDFGTTVAMGSFAFDISPVTSETTNHEFKRGTSTTFLLRLSNDGVSQDVYELSTEFLSSSGGGPWSVDIVGVDQNNRISLDAGDSALVQVRLTPPSSATVGDAASVRVSAHSLASDSTEELNLQGTITQQTNREVRVLIFQEDPYQVGVDRTTEIRVFAWNQGTAPDSIRAGFVEGSFDPDDPEQFTARFPQRTFENIAPGEVVGVPIEVTTTDNVSREQNLSFGVQFSSVNVPEETDQDTVDAVVDAVRDFNVFALNGRNTKALESMRFGRFNITSEGVGGGGPLGGPPTCEDGEDTSDFFDRNCKDYSNWTFHRLVIENKGDLEETFDLTQIGTLDSGKFSARPPEGSDECTSILFESPDSRQDRFDADDTEFVQEIDTADPGSDAVAIEQINVPAGEARTVYLRVAYNGSTPYYEDVGAGSECAFEAYERNVQISLQDSTQSKVLETETRIYAMHPNDGARGDAAVDHMEDGAVARLALEPRFAQNGTFETLPDFSGVQPGTNETLPFTLSTQAGHYDGINLTVGPRNIVEDLRDDGWTIELVPISVAGVNRTDDGVTVPASVGVDARRDGPEPFYHVTGADYTMGLKVGPPKAGVTEDIRHTFTIEAASSQDQTVRDTLGIGVQLGEDFGFSLEQGETEIKATQGDTAAFELRIDNTGASRDTYTVDATVAPGSFQTPTVRRQTVDISSGASKTVSIRVDVPQAAQTGTPATVSVEVTAEGPSSDADDDLTKGPVDYILNVHGHGTVGVEGPEDDIRIGPGGENQLNFTITNDANTQRTFRIVDVVSPSGFTTTLSEENDTISVDAQSSTAFPYRIIQAPDDITRGSVFPFVIRAEDVNDDSDFAVGAGFATVIGQTDVELTAEADRRVVDRGGNATFPVLVSNPGTQPAFYSFQTSFESSGWSARVLDAQDQPFQDDRVRVPEQSFKRVFLDVRAPDDVATGHVETVSLTAQAEGNASVTDTIDLEAAIHDYAVSIAIDGAQTKDGVPGDDVEYTVSITNEGNGEDRISLSFEALQDDQTQWPVTSSLSEDTTPTLDPGETLEDVTIDVQVPGPGDGPVPVPDGVTTVIRATSSGESPNGESPTATTQVVTRLVKYQRFDVDGDGAFEMGVDLNRDASDGFEVFADRDDTLVERGELDADAAIRSEGLYTLDADEDDRIEHIVDTNRDGIGEVYFDPDRAQTYTIPYAVDATGDGQPEHPVDSDFDGRIDGLYDPASETVHKTVHLDFSGDGRRDLLTDVNDDTFFDTFVDPNEEPPIVTSVNRDGDIYKIDTDGNGEADTHYNVETQSIEDARTANLSDFAADYWWFLVVFLLVVGLFGVIVYRRL